VSPSPSRTTTVSPGVPVPAHVTVPSSDTSHRTSPGATGAVVSTITVTGEPGVSFPAGSVATGVTVVAPSGSGAVGVHDHAPSTTVVSHSTVPSSSRISTRDPSSPDPENTGVVSFVASPSAGDVTTGASGAVVSTMTVTGEPGVSFPAGSV